MDRRAGRLRGYRLDGARLLADYGGPVLAVTFVAAGTVRIRLAPEGTFAPRRSWSPVPPEDEGRPPAARVTEDGGAVEFASDLLTVRVAADGTVRRHRTARDERHWRVGGDDEPTHQP